jgi:hypothetical protein
VRGASGELFAAPRHHHTAGLMRSIPRPGAAHRDRCQASRAAHERAHLDIDVLGAADALQRLADATVRPMVLMRRWPGRGVARRPLFASRPRWWRTYACAWSSAWA